MRAGDGLEQIVTAARERAVAAAGRLKGMR
jgi:hypothetical protein